MGAKILAFNNSEVALKLGKKAYDELEYDRAYTYFQRALEGKPNDFEAHFYLSAILEIQGDLYGAIREFETLIILKPEDIELKEFVLDMYFKTEQYLKAFSLLKQLVREYPDEDRYWVRMSDVLFIHKKFQLSLQILLAVEDATEKSENLSFKIMLIYRELNLTSQALMRAEELLTEKPNNPVYHYFIGTIYQANNDLHTAFTYFRKAFKQIETNAATQDELHSDIRQRLLEINSETQFLLERY